MRPPAPSDPQRQWVQLPKGPMAYTDVGRGPIVLAIHGCPGSVMDWRWLGVPLEKETRLLRVDLPGFGETALHVGPGADMASRAHHVIAFMDAMGIDSCTLLAHSAGGLVALELAARHSERIERVALIAVPGTRPHQPIRNYPHARWVSRCMRVPLLNRYLTRMVRQGFKRAGFPSGLPTETIRQTIHIIAHMDFTRQTDNIARIDMPTFLAWAMDDHFIEADISHELSLALPEGPRLLFDDGGHYIQKTQSVEIAEAFLKWLNG